MHRMGHVEERSSERATRRRWALVATLASPKKPRRLMEACSLGLLMPVVRRAARLIALDAADRILLLQYARPNGEKFWATPGGGLEPGETFEMAAAREAAEELRRSSPSTSQFASRPSFGRRTTSQSTT
jgi:hypothetical protein